VKRVAVTVEPAALEDAYDVLLPLVPAGVHEREAGDGLTELSWYGDGVARERLDGIARGWTVEDAPEDRAARRARFGHVWNVAGRLVVRSAMDPPAPGGVPEIVIESVHGEFGTGAHPTTRASLELLLDVEAAGSFADLGCGSGVLAVAAARFGHAPVIAVDYEPASVEAAAENAARNDVRIEAFEVDLTRTPPPPAVTLAANVPLAVHRAVAGRLDARTRTVIASGLTAAEVDEAAELYEAGGLRPARRIEDHGWAALLFVR